MFETRPDEEHGSHTNARAHTHTHTKEKKHKINLEKVLRNDVDL